MRYFALTNILAASLATSPVDGLHSMHSSQGTARVQKLQSAVTRAPIVESSMSTPSLTDEPSTRRGALQSILFGGSVAFMAPLGARALDMDAFANSQVRFVIYSTWSSKLRTSVSSWSRTYPRTHPHALYPLFQLAADTNNCDPKKDPKCIPKLNSDEALCKYGQSGAARGEACKRVKEAKQGGV
jgi:hypothetical protein